MGGTSTLSDLGFQPQTPAPSQGQGDPHPLADLGFKPVQQAAHPLADLGFKQAPPPPPPGYPSQAQSDMVPAAAAGVPTQPTVAGAGPLGLPQPSAHPAANMQPSLVGEAAGAVREAATHPVETLVGADLPSQTAEKQAMLEQGAASGSKLAQSALDVQKTAQAPVVHWSDTKTFQKLADPQSKNVFSRALTGGSKALEALSSPENLEMLGTIPFVPEEAQQLLSGVFGAQMVQGAGTEGYAAIKAAHRGDYGEAAERGATALINAAMAAASAKHAAGGEAATVKPAEEKPVLHTSNDVEELRASAERQSGKVGDAAAAAAKDVPGAKLEAVRDSKDTDRIEDKAERQGVEPNQIADIAAAKITVPDQAAADKVLENLHKEMPVESVNGSLNEPGKNGVRQVQAVVDTKAGEGEPVKKAEVLIQTPEMAEATARTHDDYRKSQELRAEGKDAEADALEKKITAEHEAAAQAGGTQSNQREGGTVVSAGKESEQAASTEPKYKFGSTQTNIPRDSEAAQALATARGKIDKADLMSTEYGGNGSGLEEDPHVTVRYGIKGEDTAKLRKFIESQAPFEATLGKTDSFPATEHSDGGAPIIAPVNAPELHRMEAEMDNHGDFADRSFPEYKPHATLGYVKPEAAEKYKGMAETDGKKFRVDSIAITDRNGNAEEIPLKGSGGAKDLFGNAVEEKPKEKEEPVQRMPVGEMTLDPKRFQYKLNTDATGVTNLLKGRKWNEDLAGLISAWRDPADGKVYVVNGHHRFQLARENGVSHVSVRLIDVPTAQEARAVGALQNIAEGHGTPLDAAKFFRDSGYTPERLDSLGVSMGEATAANGVALARLDQSLFDQVVSGKLRQGRAIAIGNASADAADQEALMKLIARAEGKGRKVTDDVVDELARMVKGAGSHSETQHTLFGAQEMTKNLAIEKAEISNAIRERIGQERRTFQGVADAGKAATLGQVKGQTIKAAENADIAKKAAQSQELYDKLSTRGGRIDDILNGAAKELAAGGNANAIKQRAYNDARTELSKTLAGATGADDQRVQETPQKEERPAGSAPKPLASRSEAGPNAGGGNTGAARSAELKAPKPPSVKPDETFKPGRQNTPVQVRDADGNWQRGTLNYYTDGKNGHPGERGRVTLDNGEKIHSVKDTDMKLDTAAEYVPPSGRKAEMKPVTDLPEEAAVIKRTRENLPELTKTYLAKYEKDGVVTVATDAAKELYPEFKEDPTRNERLVHVSASAVADAALNTELAKPVQPGKHIVDIVTASPGSGKTFTQSIEADNSVGLRHEIIMTNPADATALMQKILDSGRKPSIQWIYVDDPAKTVTRMAFRAAGHDGKPGIGRTVPLQFMAEAYTKVPKILLGLMDEFGDRIEVRAVDNSGGPGEAKLVEDPRQLLEKRAQLDQKQVHREMESRLETLKDQGVFKGEKGQAIYEAANSTEEETAGAGAGTDRLSDRGSNGAESRGRDERQGEDRSQLSGSVLNGKSDSGVASESTQLGEGKVSARTGAGDGRGSVQPAVLGHSELRGGDSVPGNRTERDVSRATSEASGNDERSKPGDAVRREPQRQDVETAANDARASKRTEQLAPAAKRSQRENAANHKSEVVEVAGQKALVLDPDGEGVWHRLFRKVTDSDGKNLLGAGEKWRGVSLTKVQVNTALNYLHGAIGDLDVLGAPDGGAREGYQRLAKMLKEARNEQGGATILRGDYRADTAREEATHQWQREHGLDQSDAIRDFAERPEFEAAAEKLRDMGYEDATPRTLAIEAMAKAMAGDQEFALTDDQRENLVRSFLTEAVEEKGPAILKNLPETDPRLKDVIEEIRKGYEDGEQHDQRNEGGGGQTPRGGDGQAGREAGQTDGAGEGAGRGQRADEGAERGVQKERAAEGELKPPRPPERKRESTTGSEEPVFQRVTSKNLAPRPPSMALPGMEDTDAERKVVAAEEEGKSLTEKMREPLKDISKNAGKMERESPLFFGKGDQPLLFQRDKAVEESPAFRKWFGDSKVAEEDGTPKVVYHGTPADFDTFDAEKNGTHTEGDTGDFGKALYFADSPHTANNYVFDLKKSDKEGYNGGKVMPVYLKAEHPLVLEAGDVLSGKFYDLLEKKGALPGAGETPEERWLSLTPEEQADAIRAAGYDSVHQLGYGQWAVYDPTSVKSATGNRGTFDPENANILFQKAKEGENPVAKSVSDLVDDLKALPKSEKGTALDRVTTWSKDAIDDSLKRSGKALGGVPSAFEKAFAWAKATTAALVHDYTHPLEQTDWKTQAGQMQLAQAETALKLQDLAKELKVQAPRQLDRIAMTHYMEAGGSDAKLKEWQAGAKARAMQAMGSDKARYLREAQEHYDQALKLTPEQKALAKRLREHFDDTLDIAKQNGLLEFGYRNYVMHLYEKADAANILHLVDTSDLNPDPAFIKRRFHDTFYSAEGAGLTPKTKDIGYLLTAYDKSMNEAIASRNFMRNLLDAKAPDGRPVAAIKTRGGWVIARGEQMPQVLSQRARPASLEGYRDFDRPQLRNFLFKPTTADLEGFDPKLFDEDPEKLAFRGDLIIHPKYASRVEDMLTPSWFERGEGGAQRLGNAIVKGSALAKELMTAVAPFHMVQEGVHGMEHKVNPFNLPKIDLEDKTQRLLASHGLTITNYDAEGLFGTRALKGIGEYVPGVNKAMDAMQSFSHWQFQDYIPRLKMQMAREAFERNVERYPKLSEEQVAELTAKQSNAAFGNLNTTFDSIPRTKTFKTLLRLATFAPDFLESRMRFVGQAFTKYGGEQRAALIRGALAMYVVARVSNALLNDGDAKWDAEHAFSIVRNGKSYSLRTVQGDILHAVTDPRGFIYNRLNPLTTRPIVEFLSGRDQFGRQKSAVSQVKDLAKSALPFGIQKVIQTPDEDWLNSILTSTGLEAKNYRTPTEEAVHKLYLARIPDSPEDEEKEAESRRNRQIEDKVRSGHMTPAEVWQMVNDGKLTPKEAGRTIQRAQLSRLQVEFKPLKLKDAMKVYSNASPLEQAELKPELARKGALIAELPEADREKASEKFQELLAQNDQK